MSLICDFLEILLFTSKLILFLSESKQNHNLKIFLFVCNCVCVRAFSGNPCLAEKGFNVCCYEARII